jgi:hypothetical protein
MGNPLSARYLAGTGTGKKFYPWARERVRNLTRCPCRGGHGYALPAPLEKKKKKGAPPSPFDDSSGFFVLKWHIIFAEYASWPIGCTRSTAAATACSDGLLGGPFKFLSIHPRSTMQACRWSSVGSACRVTVWESKNSTRKIHRETKAAALSRRWIVGHLSAASFLLPLTSWAAGSMTLTRGWIWTFFWIFIALRKS